MHYTVKLSSKNQITLPVDLLKNIQAKSGDILTMSLKNNSQVVIESLSNIKRRAMEHLSIMNPYNLSKKKIDSLNKKDLGYGDMAVARYERYLKSTKRRKKQTNES